jgi:hypothetical protein
LRSLAALVNADSKALKEIGSLKQEGETALLYFQHMTALVYGQLDAELSQEQKIEEIFKQWAGSDGESRVHTVHAHTPTHSHTHTLTPSNPQTHKHTKLQPQDERQPPQDVRPRPPR